MEQLKNYLMCVAIIIIMIIIGLSAIIGVLGTLACIIDISKSIVPLWTVIVCDIIAILGAAYIFYIENF